jgi:hypothetical protein
MRLAGISRPLGFAALVLLNALLLPRISDLARQRREIADRHSSIDALASRPADFDVAAADILDPSVYEPDPSAVSPSGRLIVIVGTRACTFCGDAWQAWQAAAGSRWADAASEFWYVTLDDDPTPSVLSAVANGPTTRVKRPLHFNTRAFSARTGVRVVPLAFVFDGPASLACVVSGVPEPAQIATCVAPEGRSKRGTLFFRNTASRQALGGQSTGESPIGDATAVP